MLNQYKIELLEYGVAERHKADGMVEIINRELPLPYINPIKLACGSGPSPRAAGKDALRNVLKKYGGVNSDVRIYKRLHELSGVEFIDPEELLYVQVIILVPATEDSEFSVLLSQPKDEPQI